MKIKSGFIFSGTKNCHPFVVNVEFDVQVDADYCPDLAKHVMSLVLEYLEVYPKKALKDFSDLKVVDILEPSILEEKK